MLLAFAGVVIGTDRAALDTARMALAETLGPAALTAAAAVAANFTKNDRIANGLGIPVDPMVLKATEQMRAELGLNDYPSAQSTFRHMTDG